MLVPQVIRAIFEGEPAIGLLAAQMLHHSALVTPACWQR